MKAAKNFVCFECGAPAEHNHHVVPRSLGGTKMVPLCRKCHSHAHACSDYGPTMKKLIVRGRAKPTVPDLVYWREVRWLSNIVKDCAVIQQVVGDKATVWEIRDFLSNQGTNADWFWTIWNSLIGGYSVNTSNIDLDQCPVDYDALLCSLSRITGEKFYASPRLSKFQRPNQTSFEYQVY